MRTKLPSPPTRAPLTPAEMERRKAEASRLHSEIKETIQSLKNGEKHLIEDLAKQLGVAEKEDRNRLIWHCLVKYANADLDIEQGLGEGIMAFDILTFLCVNRLSDSLGPENPLSDLSPFKDLGGSATRMAYQLRVCRLQEQVRGLLGWLADPNGLSNELKRRALQFLMEHGSRDALRFDAYPNGEFDETGNNGYPLFYWKMPEDYKTIFTPAAVFILDQIDKYQEFDLELAEAVPLIICKRLDCRRLAVAARRTKDFCTDSCRALHRQKNKKKDWAKYMREYRAKNY